MLYSKSWKSCKKNFYKIAIRQISYSLVFPAILMLLLACSDTAGSDKFYLSLSSLDGLRNEDYIISSDKVYDYIAHMSYTKKGELSADAYVRQYYADKKPLLWVDYDGLTSNADSLIDFFSVIDSLGFNRRAFGLIQLEEDVERFRNLDFNKEKSTISKVIARIEFNLTTALLRYARGERFGFTSPKKLNRLDVIDGDTINIRYRCLYDVNIEHPTDSFFNDVINRIKGNSLINHLKSLSPHSDLYKRLYAELQQATTPLRRQLIMVNMEKCRWRAKNELPNKGKRIVVNIPSCLLYAYNDDDTTLVMRVGCGSVKTKTPLLNSHIYRMDINPKWIIPQSIVKKDIAHHAGNAGYFARHRYYVCERPSFKKVSTESVTRNMLLSGNYAVVQEGGNGNALGRIIFRFANNLSVYLHDTSNRGVFDRDDRRVSHGCVRVQKPFELAKFLLGNDDEETLSKIEYSMTADMRTRMVDSIMVAPKIDKSKIINSKKVEPKIPLAITYYTIFPDVNNYLATYDDIYGYDKVILNNLKTFFQ